MPRKTAQSPAGVEATLELLGENIRLARLRRKISTTMMAERAGMSRPTLRSIEKGSSNVALGAYANVLFCLGLEKDLLSIGRDDLFGRKLQDAGLVQKRSRSKVKD